MKSFLQSVADDVLFAVEFLGIVTLIFLLAYAAEKWMQKRQGKKEKIFTTRKMAMIGMFSALATILMILEIPVFFTISVKRSIEFEKPPKIASLLPRSSVSDALKIDVFSCPFDTYFT